MMILVERIAEFLRGRMNLGFCDACLPDLLDVNSIQQISRYTEPLGRSEEFARSTKRCVRCGRE